MLCGFLKPLRFLVRERMKPELLKVQTLARHAKRVQDFANLRLSLIFKFRSSRLTVEKNSIHPTSRHSMDLTQDAESQSVEAVTDPEQLHQELLEFSSKFKDSISQVIIGQQEILDQLVVALFCRGHVLITGVPGLAKTLLIRSLAQLFHLKFNRIQCTPDLMPSDITGVEILEESGTDRSFRFIPGPVFTNLLLADEINRTSPRTQAALLQAMQEQEVTVSGQTRTLEDPFIVFATQNPIDSEGTYPLPEAQLDRFMMEVQIDYPDLDAERAMVLATTTNSASDIKAIACSETATAFPPPLLATEAPNSANLDFSNQSVPALGV